MRRDKNYIKLKSRYLALNLVMNIRMVLGIDSKIVTFFEICLPYNVRQTYQHGKRRVVAAIKAAMTQIRALWCDFDEQNLLINSCLRYRFSNLAKGMGVCKAGTSSQTWRDTTERELTENKTHSDTHTTNHYSVFTDW